ncbi:MAG: sulfatase [Candidatus Hydrogenedentes bacterium]|nr:sulfatase [Candidatus Hydrogenedentota bacterium]
MRLLILAFLLLPALSFAAPPNVVLILSDDQAWGDYSFMGHPQIQTPNIDRLAEAGMTYTRGYVPTSLCRPSLMTFATGLYPHQHKVTGNDPMKGVDRNLMLKHIDAATTLMDRLGEVGYVSHQSGKWWEGAPARGGFTQGMTHGDVARGGRHGDEGLKIGREGLAPIATFLDETKDKPFFLWYAPFMPHEPHTPPERLLEKYRAEGRSEYVAKYWAMCEWFDETIGEFMALLEQRGVAENTLVVYVTDNGWIQNENERGFAPRSKRSPYDGGVRTPIIFRWPGKITPSRNDTTLVSSVDIVPTILEACGIAPVAELPGVSLLNGPPAGRNQVFGEIYSHDVADIDNPAASLFYRWTVAGDWKLILPARAGETAELYNITADPWEKENLAGAQPERVEVLTKSIDAWWLGK